jgi:cytoskeletal protein CcmA (bactofilin family)
MKSISTPGILKTAFLTLLILVTSAPVFGSVFESGKSVVISNVHVVDDDLYVYSNDFRMEGTINGDLCVFAYESKIQGLVSRAVNVFARSASHVGRCEGPFRSFSETLTMDGTVGGSATVIGRLISINKGAVIERDLVARASTVEIDGTIKGKLDAKGDEIIITGQIGGDVVVGCKRLWIKPPAVISGNLTFACEGEPQIDSSGVTIVGTVKRAAPKVPEDSAAPLLGTIATRVSGLCAAFLFGLILVRLFPSYARASYLQLTGRFTTSLATGLLVIGIIVMCLVVLVLTLVTGIAGQILFSAGQTGAAFGVVLTVFAILMLPISSFSALSGTILFYAGRVFVAFFLGALILRKSPSRGTLPGSGAMFIGLLVLSILFWIPVGGTIIYLFAAATGAGAIVLGIKDCRKFMADANGATTPPSVQ